MGTHPVVHVGRRLSAPTRLRNNAASGQLAANASLTRLAVSLTRAAIFNKCSWSVENSPLASGRCLGMASHSGRDKDTAPFSRTKKRHYLGGLARQGKRQTFLLT